MRRTNLRLWSIHPKYLDTKGLVAVWRGGLLALNVLRGNTVGYRNHPQLDRFKASQYPIDSMNYYLAVVLEEANLRGYNFDGSKIGSINNLIQIPVTTGQLAYEWNFLQQKLIARTGKWNWSTTVTFHKPHPLFKVIDGNTEPWEKVKEM